MRRKDEEEDISSYCVTSRKRETGSTPENSLWKYMHLSQDRLHNDKYKYDICHLVPLLFEVKQALFFPSVRERGGECNSHSNGSHVDR